MKNQRRFLPLLLWIFCIAVCGVVIAHTRFIADLSAFMPKNPSERQKILVDQLRDGAIARLILIGIEGGNATEGAGKKERARLSQQLAAQLRANPTFTGVQNGDDATSERDRNYFFENRYLLSPSVTADRFTAPGLRSAITDTLDAMAGDAGLLIKHILQRDPTGETLQLLDQFTGENRPRNSDGAWASHDGKRALLLAQIRDSGLNTDAQARALEIIRTTFNQIPQRANDTRLVMSGTSVLSVDSRNTIESEVKRLASISLIIVIGLLLLIYRSPLLVALGMLPVLTGAVVGMTAVSLAFGHIHGLTLAFGTTLIGESVDYSIYLFIQGAGGVNSRTFWRTIRLGVLTSIAGFAALLFSSFPGLSQLGLYSLSGLIAAALVTRYVLPDLMPAAIDSRRIVKVGAILTRIFERAKNLRWVLYFLLVIALGYIVSFDGTVWNRQLSALSPISKSAQQLDMELRSDMGGTNIRYFASFVAADEETALQGAERASRLLQPLIDQHIIGGFNSPSFMLPSIASQRERQAALPDENNLRNNLREALQGLPLKDDALQGFIADVGIARTHAPLTRADLTGTSASALFDSLLIKRANDFLVLIPLTESGEGPHDDEIDVSKVSAALQAPTRTQAQVDAQTHFTVIDLLEETTSVFDGYLREASLLAGLGCVAITVLLLATSPLAQALRIMLALTCAVLCVVALLLAFGVHLNMLHLIGLLLVVAVGSNYALFFNSDAQAHDSATQSKVAVSVLIANFTAVGGFGLLGLSTVPVLSAIGSSVGIGTFLALIFSAILADTKSSTA